MAGAFDPYQEWLGIDPGEQPVDHYRLLGINQFESDVNVIHQAADARMVEIRLHQLGPHGRHTQELLNAISAARICLVEPASKQAYDGQLVAISSPGERSREVAVTPVPPPVPPPVSRPAKPPVVPVAAEASGSSLQVETVDSPRNTWKVLAGIGVILLVALGVWGAGWWMGRESLPVAERQESSKEDEQQSMEDVTTEVVVNQEATGAIELAATVATLHGQDLRYQLDGLEGQVEKWSNTNDWMSWKFRVVTPGFFKAYVQYSAAQDADQGTYILQVDQDAELVCTVVGSETKSVRTDEYTLVVRKGGTHRLSLKAASKPGRELMILKSIRLIPVKKPG